MLKDLEEELKTLEEVDKKIIAARRTGIALIDLTEEQFEVAITGIIFNISVICGCQLPTHDAHVNALEKEFTIFLKEFGYKELTTEEILTAFRMNSNFQLEEKVETYGALFNIDFASKVLSQYRRTRKKLDNNLGVIFTKKQTDKIFNDESDKRRGKVKQQFEFFLSGKNIELDLSDCYMQLCEDGAFKNRSASDFFNPDRNRGQQISLQEEFKNISEKLEKRFDAEKKAVRFLFENMKATNKLTIYDNDLKLKYPGFEMPEEKIKPDDF